MTFRVSLISAALGLLLAPALPASAHGASCHRAPPHAAAAKPSVEHARYLRSVHRYALPNLKLIDQDGHAVSTRDVFADDADLAVNFIFTSCTTVCPVMTATFAALDRSGSERIRRVSISIDPEHDRPTVLQAYAKQFRAPTTWRFYTGDSADIRTLLAAFEVYTGDKSNHRPVTLLRAAHAKEWIRIDGFSNAAVLSAALHPTPAVAESR